jgi:Outer membrane receptor proteins, mostly Fe transport
MWQFTEELQLIGQTDRLEWVAGLYYLNVYHPEGGTHTSINYAFQLMPSDLNGGLFPVSASPPGFVENKAYAVFGQGTFHLNDRLDATLGVRQSWDERSAFHGSSGVGYNKKLDHFDWTAILTYRPSDTVTTYGKLATAYLSGGVSGESQVPYDPEEVFQAELGVKADLFGRRLRANVATFWSDYKDIQVLDFSTGEVRFVNAAAATVYGAEVELTAVPTDQLELGLSYGYTNFKYDEFILGGVDVTHTQRAWFRPEHTGNVSAEYRFGTFPWGGALSLRVDASYQSKIFFAPVQSNPEYDAASIGDPRWELNARATLADIPLGSAKGRLSLWGRNLANEDELEFAASGRLDHHRHVHAAPDVRARSHSGVLGLAPGGGTMIRATWLGACLAAFLISAATGAGPAARSATPDEARSALLFVALNVSESGSRSPFLHGRARR